MKKSLGILLCASAFATGMFADEGNSNGIFFGASLGINPAGVVQLAHDNNAYTFRDGSGASSSDLQLQVGYGSWYLFYQKGTIGTETAALPDIDYSAFGAGYLLQGSKKYDLNIIELGFEGDAEIGADTISGMPSAYGGDATGLLISVDGGVVMTPKSLKNIEFTARLGVDVHAINNSYTYNGTSSSDTWNFMTYGFNFGVRYKF